MRYSASGCIEWNAPSLEERFKSDPLEDVEGDMHALAALRRIHNNQVKAGICEKLGRHPFGSYRDYWGGLRTDRYVVLVKANRSGLERTDRRKGATGAHIRAPHRRPLSRTGLCRFYCSKSFLLFFTVLMEIYCSLLFMSRLDALTL